MKTAALSRVVRLLAVCLGLGAGSANAGIRALLVGIGDYPEGCGFSKLEGPPNDLSMMRDWLVKDMAVPDSSVMILKEDQATNHGIQRAIQNHLQQGAAADDVVLFYYSGHGTQVEDLGPELDEPDRKDEALVAWGFSETDTSSWLTDDVLHRQLGAIKASHVLVMFDSCHAGSGTRGSKGSAGSFQWSNRSAVAPDTSFRDKHAPQNQVFLAACGDGEIARQVHSETADDVVGVFTEAFLTTARSGSTRADLASFEKALRDESGRVVRRLGEQFSQAPVVEGPRKDFSLADFLGGRVFGTNQPQVAQVRQVPVLDGFTPSGGIKVALVTGRDRYQWTEELTAEVTVDKPAYLRVFHVDSAGEITQIHPNSIYPQKRMEPGEVLHLPPKDAVGGKTYALRITGPRQGLEALVAVASAEPFGDREAREFAAGLFNPITDNTPGQLMTRGIVVEAAPGAGGSASSVAATARGQAVRIFRTAGR